MQTTFIHYTTVNLGDGEASEEAAGDADAAAEYRAESRRDSARYYGAD